MYNDINVLEVIIVSVYFLYLLFKNNRASICILYSHINNFLKCGCNKLKLQKNIFLGWSSMKNIYLII